MDALGVDLMDVLFVAVDDEDDGDGKGEVGIEDRA